MRGAGGPEVLDDQRVEFAHNVTLEAAPDLFGRSAFACTSFDIGASAEITAHAHGRPTLLINRYPAVVAASRPQADECAAARPSALAYLRSTDPLGIGLGNSPAYRRLPQVHVTADLPDT